MTSSPARLFRLATPTAASGRPRTIIENREPTLSEQVRELWAARELLLFLAWRDIKVRYQQTSLGIAWALLQPLTQMAIFAVIFGRYAGLAKQTEVPYLWFVLAGLVPWSFFATTLAAASHSMVSSRDMLNRVYFPRLVIPWSAVLAGLVDLAISTTMLLVLLLSAGFALHQLLVFFPLVLLGVVLAAAGAGTLLAAATAAYRDFRFVVPFIVQVGLFLSPVVYPLTLFPEGWRWLLCLNPLAGWLEAGRACLFNQWNPEVTLHLCLSAGSTLLLLGLALYVFRRMERSLVDRI